MAALPSFINAMEPIYPFMGFLGGLVVAGTIIFTVAKLLDSPDVRRINWGNVGIQLATGVVMLIPKQFLTALFSITYGISDFAFGTSKSSAPPQQSNPPAVTAPSSAPAGPADLSWVPVALTIGGLVLAATAVGLGLFHYYRKSLRPSLMKARSEAQSAAMLVTEARKTLESVVLGSASYETDLAKQIDYPMMTDVTEPTVRQYVREMRQAQEQERALAKKPLLADAERFSHAVTCLEISYEAAVRKAERVRWSSFSVAEQRRLKDARIALDVIQDSSTTAEQRNAQYKRIAKLLDGLIVLTEPVRQALSAWVPMLALGTGSATPVVTAEDKVLVPSR